MLAPHTFTLGMGQEVMTGVDGKTGSEEEEEGRDEPMKCLPLRRALAFSRK